MLSKKPGAAAKPVKAKGANLQALRAQVDKVDLQLLKLLNERAGLAQEIGRIKSEDGVDIFAPAREDEVVAKMVSSSQGPLDERAIRAVFREVMSASRSVQQRVRVAYLGPEYSFSHIAAMEKFGSTVEYVPVGSISGVFEIINRKQADYGIVPIENSTDGRIADTLDMFTRLPMKICAEVSLRVHHNLLAACSQGEVRRVYSKPQALSQCRNWLANNLPQAQLKEVASTTTAVQLAKQEPFAAAVASRQAAGAYGLNIICSDIEDRLNNITRFAVVGSVTASRTGNDKTTVLLQLADRPGSLCDALTIIKKNSVNVTWIESFPVDGSGKNQEYVFFLDLGGHADDVRVKRTLAALEKKAQRLVVLGAFAKGMCYD